MDRRILGGGAIVCSTMVLCTQPAPPGFGSTECDNNSADAIPCSSNHNNPIQEGHGDKNTAPTIGNVLGNVLSTLPAQFHWSDGQSNRLPDSMETVYGNLLKQSQALADHDHLSNAVATIAGIPKNSQHYEKAQRLQNDWSQELLQRAIDRCQQGDITTAISMLGAIPSTSPQQSRAAELHDYWSEQAALLAQAIKARDAGNWQDAMTSLESLQGTLVYNSLPVQRLLQQAISQRFQPNAALTQMASATPLRQAVDSASSQAMMVPSPNQESANVEPMPASPDLEIDLSQAIAWAQPAAPLVASRPQTQMRATPVSNRNLSIEQLPVEAAIVSPEPTSSKSTSEQPKIAPSSQPVLIPSEPLLTAVPSPDVSSSIGSL